MKKRTKIVIPMATLGILAYSALYGVSSSNAQENDESVAISQSISDQLWLNQDEPTSLSAKHRSMIKKKAEFGFKKK